MKRNVTLPVLIWYWVRDKKRSLECALFRRILKNKGIYSDPDDNTGKHTYWMNIVQSVGGSEKHKPCEYIFENPWHARMHEEIVNACQTWDFIATVKITSPVELTTTDYQRKVEEDEEYMEIIEDMKRNMPNSANEELENDRKLRNK